MKERYNPNTNPSDNVLYSVLYMSYLKHKVKTYLEYQNIQTDEEDVFLFAISAYNL
ncbi:MAG: hypothetical protein LBH96_06005 [Candidatus Peribacteria bacterium]|nr:hypothetical protein [Candidatus Peribacteria bacterium]